MTRAARLLLIPVALMQVGFFAFVAHHRFIDGDEGAFLLASRLVLEHKTPYLDFFYNQAPLLPYVYATWMRPAGISWASGRMLCVLLATVLGTLVYDQVQHETQRWTAGVAAVIVYVSSTLVFAWFSVVKTHCLTSVLLFGAYIAISRKMSPFRLGAGGLLLGLSADTRSYIVLVVPVFLWWIFHNVEVSRRIHLLGWFCSGLVVGLLPSLLLFIATPEVFLFDNLLYHGLRSDRGLIGWWQEKLVVVVQLLLGSGEGNGLQFSLLCLSSLGLGASTPDYSSRRFALLIALVIMCICLLPTPTYLQYFSLCVPFLVVSAVCSVSDLCRSMDRRGRKYSVIVASLIGLVLYVGVSIKDMQDYLFTGNGVPGLRLAEDRQDWKIQRVLAVSDEVERHAAGGTAASFWPGDIFQTTAHPLSGLENPFALPISEKLTPEQRARYHILSPNEVMAAFAAHEPKVVVLRNQILSAVTKEEFQRLQVLASEFRASLVKNGYRIDRSTGGASIYVYDTGSGK